MKEKETTEGKIKALSERYPDFALASACQTMAELMGQVINNFNEKDQDGIRKLPQEDK